LKLSGEKGTFKYMPAYCETRWWGNYALISRIIHFLPILKAYYYEKGDKASLDILEELNDPVQLAYLQFRAIFLDKTLTRIVKF
jgi:hypothetical protein